MHPHIVTLGYSHPDAQATIDELTAQGYHVGDIRLKAFSNKPGFTAQALKDRYGRVYHHLAPLGNQNYNTGSEYISLKNETAGIVVLKRLLERSPLILLCGCKWAETCHRFYVARLAQETIPGLQIEHLLQAGHAGMLKHHNAGIAGRCSWVENGLQCEQATREGELCTRCRKPVCELHGVNAWRWEKSVLFCSPCHETYVDEQYSY